MFKGGGVQECVKALQAEYTKRGHYARIITPLPRNYTGEVPDSIITLGRSVTTKMFAGSAWQWSVSVSNEAIDEVFEREKFDILHFHEPLVPVWSQQLMMRSKSANVATMHARFMDTIRAKTISTVFTPYAKPLVKMIDVATAVSEPAAEYFRTLSDTPVTIIPNGIDVKKYSKKPATAISHPQMKTILYVGRLENRKGVKYLIKAFNELAQKRQDIQLLIAGTGVDEDKLREYVKDNDIPRITFLGFISEEDKIHHLHKADLFCSPAHYGESFGIVLLEAMAAGCPIVAGDNVGYQSVLVDRGALSLVNPQDILDFARRLEIMTYDEDVRKLWLEWANEYVERFEYPKIADQYLNVYEGALTRHGERKTAA
jgi:phosphatidylinositol alpha-mannosyltransferase